MSDYQTPEFKSCAECGGESVTGAVCALCQTDCEANGLPEAYWDISTGADMTQMERMGDAYNYQMQAWMKNDHAHINPVSGEFLFCGADVVTCLGAVAVAEMAL